MWWSRDPSGLIHYYDDRESAWKPWNAEATQVSLLFIGLFAVGAAQAGV
jgi:hypothetical protein